MKKPKNTKKPGASKRARIPVRQVASAKSNPTVRKLPAARQAADTELLSESIAALSAVVAELRQIAEDLRDMMASRGEEQSGTETVLVAEVEPSDETEEPE